MNLLGLTAMLLLLRVAAPAPAAAASFPGYINYQGKLGNPAGNPLTGTYSFRFKFYDRAAGGTLLATDANYTGANAVTVTNGLYSVQIGSLTAGGLPESVFHGPETWLEIDVNLGANFTGFETLSPRERLAAVPFAFRALNAEKLGTGVFIATFTSAGDLVAPSSITANAFFGDGSHLSGIPSTAGISGTYLAKGGDAMTGSLGITGIHTPTNVAVSIAGYDSPTNGVHGNAITLRAGNGNGANTQNGGAVTIQAGGTNSTNQAGGAVSIIGGSVPGSGTGGAVLVRAGSGAGGSSVGGNLELSSGNGNTWGDVKIQLGNGLATRATFNTAEFALASGYPMKLSGSAGTVTTGSSVTASAFYGYGGNLTGVTATDATKVAKAGDTMTGLLTAPDYAATYGVSAATAMFTAKAGVGIAVLPQAKVHISSPAQIGALGQSPAILVDGDQQGRGNIHFVTHEAVGQQLAFSYPEVTSHKSFGFDSNYNAWTFMDFAAGMGTAATPQVLLGGPAVGSRFGLPTGTYLTYPVPQAQVHISSGVAGRSLLIDGDAAYQAIFNGTGRVGIGTAAPATKIHLSSGTLTIDGDVANSIHLANYDQSITGKTNGATDPKIILASSGDGGTRITNNAGILIRGKTSPDTGGIYVAGQGMDAGNVGIGQSDNIFDPATALDVYGNAQFGTTRKSTMTATGEIVSPSSITASAFYGYGGNLTGITATDSSKVAKTGDTMTGLLTAPDYAATYGVDAATFTAAIYSSAPVMIVSTISAPGSVNIYTDGGSRALVISQGANGGARVNIGTFSGSQIGNLEVFDTGSPTAYFRRNDTAVTAGEILGEMDFRDQDTSTGGSSLKAYYRVQAEGGWTSGGTMEQSHRWGLSRGGNAAADYAVLNSSGLLVNGTGYFTGAVAVGVTDAAGGTLVVQSTSTTAGNPVVSARDNGGAELLRVQQDGKVGLGTSTPGYALSVYRSGAGVTSNVESGSDGSAAQTRFAGRTGASAARVWGAGLNITDGGGGFEIYDYTAGASRLYAGVSGSVGIGTVVPAAALDVNGNAQFGTTRKSTMTATGEIVSPSSITASAFFGDGSGLTGLTGMGIIRQYVSSATTARFLLGPAIPADDTIPQISEGGQVLVATMTPVNAASTIIVRGSVNLDEATNSCNRGALCIFKDTGANALACYSFFTAGSPVFSSVPFTYTESAANTTSRNYSLRAGCEVASTIAVNMQAGANIYGGTLMSMLEVLEVSP